MTGKYEILSTEDFERPKRTAPITRILENIDPGRKKYLTYAEIAERYGVVPETMRRLCQAESADGTPKVKAPSEFARSGGLLVYLFTKADLKELDEYMTKRGYVVKK